MVSFERFNYHLDAAQERVDINGQQCTDYTV